MTQNLGSTDRLTRALLALLVITLWSTGAIVGTVAAVFGVVAGVFAVTAAAGWCPLYRVLGISTNRPSARA